MHTKRKSISGAGLSTFLLASVLSICTAVAEAGTRWDASYFPDVELITDQGQKVRFFEDLIEDRIVAILFIYTSCPDVCPLETAQMVNVQNIMGDRVGKDVFFYSITIDPETDTPQVLADYKKRFGANWTFLTGDEQDIIEIRRKLGLYIEEIQEGSLNHNVNLIIGNQKTGRWMKRSPFENPHVLADQIGNWLNGWRSASERKADYASAPELRSISDGEQLYRTRCASCHTLDGKDPVNAIGPDLLGVTFVRERAWLLDWLRAPDEMLANNDPIATALYEKYNRLPMPNMRLDRNEAVAVLEFIAEVTRAKVGKPADRSSPVADVPAPEASDSTRIGRAKDAVAVLNAWIREPHPTAPMNAGYMTMVNMRNEPLRLAGIRSEDYESVEIHEMVVEEGARKMRKLEELEIPPRGLLRLEPGARHLMLSKPRKLMRSGQAVDIILAFESGDEQLEQLVTVQVDAR